VNNSLKILEERETHTQRERKREREKKKKKKKIRVNNVIYIRQPTKSKHRSKCK